MTSTRAKQLEPYAHALSGLMLRVNSRRVLGAHLRSLRNRGILLDLHEQSWLQQTVLERVELDLAYYRSLPGGSTS